MDSTISHGTTNYEINWEGGSTDPAKYKMILKEGVPASEKNISLEIVFSGERAHCFVENSELLEDFGKFIKKQIERERMS